MGDSAALGKPPMKLAIDQLGCQVREKEDVSEFHDRVSEVTANEQEEVNR